MSDNSKWTSLEAREPRKQSNADLSSANRDTLALNHDMIVAQVSPFSVATSSASLPGYHLHFTAVPPVFFKKGYWGVFLSKRTQSLFIIYPSAGSMAFSKAVCPPRRQSKFMLRLRFLLFIFSWMFASFYSYCCWAIRENRLTVPRMKQPSCIYKRITALSSLEAAILLQFNEQVPTTCPKQSCRAQSWL